MLLSLSLIFTASAWLHLSQASPINTGSNIADVGIRDTINCTDLRAESSTLCWDQLNIYDYIAGWNRTTPTCQASVGDDSNCCNPAEPWTTCFLRLAYGHAGSDCTGVNPQTCSLGQLSPNLDPSIAPKVGYVVRTIVSINSLFISFYRASQAQGLYIRQSDSESATLKKVLNGKTELSATLNSANIAKALAAGLPFWGTSPVLAAAPQQINLDINTPAAEAFAQSLLNTPAVNSMLFGTPYNNNDDTTTNQGLSSAVGEATNLLLSALGLIMSDVPTFNAWAAHGLYSGPTTSLTIPPAPVGLTSAFTTYLVGETLSQSHFSATPASATITKEAFQNGRTCTTLGDVCKDSNGKTYYWSQAYQTQYEINEPSNWAASSSGTPVIQQLGYEASAYGLLGLIELSDVYMPVLFDGAYNCTLEGKAGGSSVNINTDDSLDVACLSSLPIYLSKGSSCPAGAVQVGGKCPFGFYG